MSRFYQLTFGCRLNQAEAAQTRSELESHGWQYVEAEQAEFISVHSCAVTEPAAHEVLRTLRALRRKAPQAKLVLSGCAAKLLPADCADLIIPHDAKETLVPKLLAFAPSIISTPTLATHTARASLIIQDGCDHFCHYCIVPYLRGAPTSVPAANVLEQAKNLIDQGFEEIVLTGCHLALYKDGEVDLLNLLEQLCALPGTVRYRLGSVEPCTLDDARLVRLIAASKGRICAFLHLPIQSGSTTELERMGRKYNASKIKALLSLIASELPQAGLGADLIIGFPGETNEEFQETCDLIQSFPFTGVHLFPYSKRPGTPAASFPNACSSSVIHERMQIAKRLAQQQRLKTLAKFVGKPLTVIPERYNDGVWEGWSEQHFRCRLTIDAVRKKQTAFTPSALVGEILV